MYWIFRLLVGQRWLRSIFSLLAMLATILWSLPGVPALADPVGPNIPLAEVQQDKDILPQLSSNLKELLLAEQEGRVSADAQNDLSIEREGDRVMVMLIMLDTASADAAIKSAVDLGGTVTAHYKTWIDAWVPLDKLEQVSRLPGVSVVRTPLLTEPIAALQDAETGDVGVAEPQASATGNVRITTGSTVTDGVEASNADVWHRAGYLGQGIRIAVLENSGNGGFNNYQRAQAAGELPAQIEFYTGPAGTNVPVAMASNHGTKAAEIVHDMAPSAQLIFASPKTGTQLAQFIIDLARNHNVDVFSASLSLSGFSPGDGTGPVAEAIAEAFHSYGALYVQSAGNAAKAHWEGGFNDSNGDRAHEFAPGDPTNRVCTNGAIYLRWNDWPASSNDFDFYLMQEVDGRLQVVDTSTNNQTGTQTPTEVVMPPKQGCYELIVMARDIDPSRSYFLNINAFDEALEYQVPARSLLETATSKETIAVAATASLWPYDRVSDSSLGPTHGPGGSRSGGKHQPRIAGFSGMATSQGTMGGTSGAAPHVAGAAALMMQRFNKNAALVKQELEKRAVDNGIVGYDFAYGSGVLQLRSPCANDPDEPNDDLFFSSGQPTPHEATPLKVNDVKKAGWLCPIGDQDWFWFNASPGVTYVIEVPNLTAQTKTRLRLELHRNLKGKPSKLLATDDAARGETASIEYTPSEAGMYFLRIRDMFGLVGSYDYEVSVRTRAVPASLHQAMGVG